MEIAIKKEIKLIKKVAIIFGKIPAIHYKSILPFISLIDKALYPVPL